VPFHVDITHILRSSTDSEVSVVVRASDPPNDVTQPRGKQYWQSKIEGIWYHPTTGIWQSCWLEYVPSSRINRATIIADIDVGTIAVTADLLNVGSTTAKKLHGARLAVYVSIEDVLIASSSSLISNDTAQAAVILSVLVNGLERPAQLLSKVTREAWLEGLALWSPDHPTLYTVRLSLVGKQGEILDQVDTYTGMRKIHIASGNVYLNNKRLFQALSLDQGYWPQAGLTAPSDDALQQDIILMKEAGLNGCRKHQKVEDPRFLYHADRLGYLVWSEMANAYDYSQRGLIRFRSEWTEAVMSNINHPSIIAWTPINESWGVPKLMTSPSQRNYLRSLYYLTKTLDSTRPVITNDGWEQGSPTDIIGFHDYGDPDTVTGTVKDVAKILMPKAGREVILPGDKYEGQPILLTEMGGFSLKSKGEGEEGHWGYAEAEDEESLLYRIQVLVDGIIEGGICQGYCYTQTTDTEVCSC
jgi:beta-galactosidase/beta-glucuronidase